MHNMRVCAFYGHFHANWPQKTIKDSCYTMSDRDEEGERRRLACQPTLECVARPQTAAHVDTVV